MEHCKKNRVVLTELGYLRKWHIMTSIRTLLLGYALLTSMQGVFSDKQVDKLVTSKFKWPHL